MLKLEIRYPFEKLEAGMLIVTKSVIGHHTIREIVGKQFRTITGYTLPYSVYDYSLVDLATAIRLEDDPIKKLALMILDNDPMALDLARDALCRTW